MSTNDTLRGLLSEARAYVEQSVAPYGDRLNHCEHCGISLRGNPKPSDHEEVCECRKAADVLERIDAALSATQQEVKPSKISEQLAEEIYNGWRAQDGWTPWVPGGNSDKQDEARREARALLATQQDDRA